ncbi:MAG: hypothetical protein ACYS3N_24250 [Planctomycetota bacterium]
MGGNARNTAFAGVSNENSDMVGVAQTDRALDCGCSALKHKSGDSKPRKRISKKTQNDLAANLAEIAEKHPDLAEIVAVWPDLPEHIKAAIKALIQTHKSGKE